MEVENKNSQLKAIEGPSIYEIPLAEAQTLTKGWADQGNFVTGFLVDAQELTDMIKEQGASYIRLYFGWDASQEPGRRERMIMVPANEYGRDMINTTTPDDSNIFDFTLPCPPTCDKESPLCYGPCSESGS